MKQWRFEVCGKPGFPDVHGNQLLEDIRELGIDSLTAVQSARVFLVDAPMGQFDEAFAQRIGTELLADPVCEQVTLGRPEVKEGTVIEVHLKSGVTDPVAQSVTTAIADMGGEVELVRTARKVVLLGQPSDDDIQTIIKRVLANDCIEDCIIGAEAEPPSPHLKPYEFELHTWPIRDLDDDQLMALSKEKDLFLNLIEMQTIQKYFQDLEREPTDIELESLAQTWSEHCVHKTLKSSVDMEFDGKSIHFDNLIKETVFQGYPGPEQGLVYLGFCR